MTEHVRPTAIDPVCAMKVDVDSAPFTSVRADETVYFCSESCKVAFDRRPTLYPSPSKVG